MGDYREGGDPEPEVPEVVYETAIVLALTEAGELLILRSMDGLVRRVASPDDVYRMASDAKGQIQSMRTAKLIVGAIQGEQDGDTDDG